VDRWPVQPGYPQHDWEAPRVAKGIEGRGKRLRVLGNAVVPQVAYEIGVMLRKMIERVRASKP
jgi:hypothetical protein